MDVIWPPMIRFLVGESPCSSNYDVPGVAVASKGQGVDCVGEDFNASIRNAAEQAVLSAAEGTSRPEGTQPLPKKWDTFFTETHHCRSV